MLKDLINQLNRSMQATDSEGRLQLKGRWQAARYIAVDLETNGLQPGHDAILAIGWVPIAPPRIRLNEADYGVIKSSQPLSQAAVIHQLSEADVRGGEPIENVLRRLALRLDGAVLVAHHASFDWAFLNHAFTKYSIPCRPLALMDTLRIERKRLARKKNWLNRGELTLAACRERYGLPAMRQHHALSDAIACAEVFLAQAYQIVGTHQVTLRQLLRYA